MIDIYNKNEMIDILENTNICKIYYFDNYFDLLIGSDYVFFHININMNDIIFYSKSSFKIREKIIKKIKEEIENDEELMNIISQNILEINHIKKELKMYYELLNEIDNEAKLIMEFINE